MDLVVLAAKGINKSPFSEYIAKEPKPRDFIALFFLSFKGNSYKADRIYQIL